VFAPQLITPSAIALLTLSAAGDAVVGTAQITVVASGGGLSHSTSSTLHVDFGLVPVCTGALTGRVTEKGTGRPLAGVPIPFLGTSIVTDEQGRFALDNLTLGPNNAPTTAGVFVPTTATHWFGSASTIIACGTVPNVEIQLEPRRWGTFSGRVTVGVPDPNNLTTGRLVTDTGVPLTTAVAQIGGTYNSPATDGTFRTPPIELHQGQFQEIEFASITAPGYWPYGLQTNVVANQNVVLPNFALVQQCTATVSGTLLYGDTHQPVVDQYLTAFSPWRSPEPSFGAGSYNYSARTDTHGSFTFSGVSLDYNNASGTFQISVQGPAGYENLSLTNVAIPTCGSQVHVDMALIHQPLPNFGAVQGHVFDVDSGAPLASARVQYSSSLANFDIVTDSQGFYSLPSILVGSGNQASSTGGMGVGAAGYYSDGGFATVTVRANETLTMDFRLLRIRYAQVKGTIRDAASHAPISGAVVDLSNSSKTTGPDGTYLSDPIPTPYPGVAFNYSFSVTTYDQTLWSDTLSTTLVPNQTSTADANLLRRCQSATLIGSVINALTQQPIEGASVRWGPQLFQQTLTDAQGRYVLTDIPVGFKNAPNQIGLTASAANFNSQSRTITVFCGATIVMDFGRPASAFSTVEGHVTNAVTGQAIGGAFVGSEFGGSTSTDYQGFYRLVNVPLGAGDAPRDWKITASRPTSPSKIESLQCGPI
jgi:hypothetical protein